MLSTKSTILASLSTLSIITGKPATLVLDADINTNFDANFNEVYYNVTRAVPLLTSAPISTLYPTWFFDQEGYQTYSIKSWGCWCHFVYCSRPRISSKPPLGCGLVLGEVSYEPLSDQTLILLSCAHQWY